MIGKIRAAIDTREDSNFLIIARCDARAVEGPESMYERLTAYAEAGADFLYAEAPRNGEDIREDARRLSGKAPLYLVSPWLGPSYGLTFKDVADMGYSIVIVPEIGFTIAPKALYDAAVEMRETGIYPDYVKQGKQFTWKDTQDLIRLPEVQSIEDTYLPIEVKMERWKSEELPESDDYFIEGTHR